MTKTEVARKIYEHLLEIRSVINQLGEKNPLHFSASIIQHEEKEKGDYYSFTISETGKSNSWKLRYDNVTSDHDRGVYYSEEFVGENLE